MLKKETVAVMYGGNSAEHEISVITALQCIQAIDSHKYNVVPIYLALNGKWYTGEKLFDKNFYRKMPPLFSAVQEITLLPDPSYEGFVFLSSKKALPVDVCLLAFHGQNGEDGCIQGLLELADLPYTGGSVSSSSLAMNKYLCKTVVSAHGIPVLPSVLVHKKNAICEYVQTREMIFKTLQFPLFIKPNHLGSSIGVSRADTIQELNAGLAKVFQYDDQAIIEPCLENILEINVAVLDGQPPRASLVETPIPTQGALSYEDKYLRQGGKKSGNRASGMASLSRLIDPENLDHEIKVQVQEYGLNAFQILECSGVSRFDFMMDTKAGNVYFNEVNPIPGSFSFYLWDQLCPKVLFTDLLESLIVSAKEKKTLQRSLNREFGFHAL